MTTPRKRKPTPAVKETSPVSELSSKVDNSLVFISHDTKDAELAEEFSKLLKSASSGALKSFRSSDNKGTQGIEYGEEWYPAIMDKIDEASDVVCLLTRHSIDRPWILYEAGVAKGKLDKKVIGIALGIPFKDAISGPFAQFQNNNGDVDSITTLVLSLVKKIGLDPDQELVKMLVEKFTKRVEEINTTVQKESSEESSEANSVTKLFEEVKIMFDALPVRIENRLDSGTKKRKRRFHPVMLEELMHLGRESKDFSLGFLMMISFFKDDYPWLYEIGLETYKGLNVAKSTREIERLIRNFDRALDMLNHPIMREFHDRSDETYFFMKEASHMIRHYLERFIHKDIKDNNIE